MPSSTLPRRREQESPSNSLKDSVASSVHTPHPRPVSSTVVPRIWDTRRCAPLRRLGLWHRSVAKGDHVLPSTHQALEKNTDSWSIGQPASQPAQSSRASGWHIGWGEYFPSQSQPVAVGPVVTPDWHRQGWAPRLGPKRKDIDQLVV